MNHGPQDRRREISRRDVLGGTRLAGGVLVAAAVLSALPAAAKAKQMSQSAAAYQTHPKGAARCDKCALFQPPAACQTVAGVISPSGWCILFAAK